VEKCFSGENNFPKSRNSRKFYFYIEAKISFSRQLLKLTRTHQL